MSLHFSKDKDVFNIDEFILHEGIHRIQDKRKKNGNLMSLGLCRFTDTKVKGLYLNEAAVQYIVSSILEKEKAEIQKNKPDNTKTLGSVVGNAIVCKDIEIKKEENRIEQKEINADVAKDINDEKIEDEKLNNIIEDSIDEIIEEKIIEENKV